MTRPGSVVRSPRVLVEAIGREKDTSAQACLTSALSELAGRMEPSEASAMLAAAIGRNVDTGLKIYVATTLSAVAGRMDASELARICGPILKALAEEFNRQTDASPRDYLAEGLSALASRIDPREAAKICGPMAQILARDLEDQENPDTPARVIGRTESSDGQLALRCDPHGGIGDSCGSQSTSKEPRRIDFAAGRPERSLTQLERARRRFHGTSVFATWQPSHRRALAGGIRPSNLFRDRPYAGWIGG